MKFVLAQNPEPALRTPAAEGEMLEISAAGHRLIYALASRVAKQGGAALFIDYGHATTDFSDTLQALRAHRPVDPLSEPGDCDITAHVDFDAMARSARAAGAAVYGPIDQGDFLRSIGLEERAEALIARASDPKRAADIESARQRLAGKGAGEMGALFKTMVIANRALPVPPGFQPPLSAAE